MKRKGLLFVGLNLLTLAGCVSPQNASQSGDYSTISSYTEAYNDRDIQAMSALMHPDIQWLNVEGHEVSVIADGKADLVAQMNDYVLSPSATTSTLEGAVADGPFMALREVARWPREDGSIAEQSALAVYEIRDGLVRRVWYFPVTRKNR